MTGHVTPESKKILNCLSMNLIRLEMKVIGDRIYIISTPIHTS